MSTIPDSEVIKVFGPFRIIKQYYEGYKSKEIGHYCILERQYKNSMGEVYHAKAIDYSSSQGINQEEAHRKVFEFDRLLQELLFELVK